jgi:hypothetical protein
MNGMETSAVHSFQQHDVATSIDDRDRRGYTCRVRLGDRRSHHRFRTLRRQPPGVRKKRHRSPCNPGLSSERPAQPNPSILSTW